MKKKTTDKDSPGKLYLPHNRIDPFVAQGSTEAGATHYWRWGDDNLFPNALALMARRSTTHRRIINDKADYVSGKGFSFNEGDPALARFIGSANGTGETLRQVFNKLAFDKALFGNAFLEIVTTPERSFLSFYHQDASKCRIAKESDHVLLHHDWQHYTPSDAKRLPLYPRFEQAADGTLRSMFHYKDYEPMFEHYGVPPYIAGFSVSAIAWKTDRWNISRLDNSFQLSGVMMLDSSVDNEAEAERIVRLAEQKFAGNPGQVMFVIRDGGEGDNSRFIPIAAQNEGDWQALHEQAADATVLIVAQRISTIMNAEQILVLEDGKIVGKGTHEELMKNCSAYQEIARSQLSESELKGGMAE